MWYHLQAPEMKKKKKACEHLAVICIPAHLGDLENQESGRGGQGGFFLHHM